MSSLFDSLRTAGGALGVYQRALEIVQNNVTNSMTPGFARQRLQLEARPLDLAAGLAGGVADRGLDTARNEYAEDEVRRQLQLLGFAEANVEVSGSIERLFDVSGEGGVPGALTALFRSFSAWSAAPSDTSARASVIDAAGVLAARFRSQAMALRQTAEQVQGEVGVAVDRINELAAVIQRANVQRRQHEVADPGQDATVHAALEELAQLVDFTVLAQADGTFTVVLNGGAPLVIGEGRYPIESVRDDAGLTAILDSEGRDATAQISGGQLGGLLDAGRRMIPEVQASFDRFAAAFAATVNGILTSGSVAPGSTTAGAPLFVWDPTQPARTLAVSDSITFADLAPVDASGNANRNALRLATLANSTEAGGVDGVTFGDFLSNIAAAAGRESAAAQQDEGTLRQLVGQIRSLRDRLSGVSLDEEAMLLMQFQKSYQAAARLVTTLNEMAGEILNMVR